MVPLKTPSYLFLFLLPVFFVLHGYLEFYDIILGVDFISLLIPYSLAALSLWMLSFFLLKNWQKAALFSFALLCFQFFFGSLHDTAKSIFDRSFLVKYSFLLPLSLTLFVLLFLVLRRITGNLNKLGSYLTAVLSVLILIDAIQLINKASWMHKKFEGTSPVSFELCDSCAKPDIYLIVADEYSGYEPLKNLLNFDNREFEHELKRRGFHVVNNPISNYNSSPFSIASLVNMDYLNGIVQDDDNKNDLKLCYEEINRNSVAAFFKETGYTIINNSIFNFAGTPSEARISLFPTKEGLISSQTFSSRIIRDVAPSLLIKFSYESEFERFIKKVHYSNEKTITRLRNMVKTQSSNPRFVYTHLLMPHDPYYFDKDGRPYPAKSLLDGQEGKEREYVEYLQYCNKRFTKIFDYILTHSNNPPIIIFMSDHGFRYYAKPVHSKYEFMNINAVYLPNKKYKMFYDGMSNVNQFRVLLNSVFGQRLPLLKDSTIFIK